MMQLPNGCRISRMAVSPANWKTKKASVKKPWLICYRFYDPAFPKPKQVAIRGMNKFPDLASRQQATEDLLQLEMDLLTRQGYNPHKKQYLPVQAELPSEVDPMTNFIDALWIGLGKVQVTRQTMNDMKSVIRGVQKAANDLFYQYMTVGQVSRKHIKAILEQCGRNNKRWSPRRFNLYRAYISRVYKELIEMEAVDTNPVRDIQTMVETVNIREVLTIDERDRINDYLKPNHYHFWRFLQVFFRSGARESELMKVQAEHVDLAGQRYRVFIRKGRQAKWVYKTIASSVLDLWTEAMSEACPGDYLFSKHLKPGPNAIRPDQVGRRWTKYVKNHLGIKKDLYSLKHLNTSLVVDHQGTAAAAANNSHTSTAMVIRIYDTVHDRRIHDQLKDIPGRL